MMIQCCSVWCLCWQVSLQSCITRQIQFLLYTWDIQCHNPHPQAEWKDMNKPCRGQKKNSVDIREVPFYIFSSNKIKPVASLIDTETLKEGHRTISTQTVQWYRYFSCRDNETLYIEINNLRNAPRRTQQNQEQFTVFTKPLMLIMKRWSFIPDLNFTTIMTVLYSVWLKGTCTVFTKFQ